MTLPSPIKVLGVRVDCITREQLIGTMIDWSLRQQPRRIHYANSQTLNLAYTDRGYKGILNSADLVFCDGFSVLGAARVGGVMIPQRLTVMDWLDELFHGLARECASVFLVGGASGTVERCVARIMIEHPDVEVVGWHHGFFVEGSDEERSILDQIGMTAPNIILVGLGSPKQETWVVNNRSEIGSRLVVTVGGAFRWYSGDEKAAPRVWADNGFEWLWRLLHHPVALFNRYIVGLPVFAWRVVLSRFADSHHRTRSDGDSAR